MIQLPVVGDLEAVTKKHLYAKGRDWERLPLSEVPALADQIPPREWDTGRTNLYLSAAFQVPDGVAHWPALDVEHAGAHDDISRNLHAARETVLTLDQAGLWHQGVQVLLTGRGVRLVWPLLICPEQAAMYELFLKDRARWPHIDPSSNLKGTPLRLAGYRGHLRQTGSGAPLKRHIHIYDDPKQIFELDVQKYVTLVDGPDERSAHVALIDAALPRQWAGPGHPWFRFLETYRHQAALQSSLVEVVLPRPTASRRRHLAAVLAHAARMNIGLREREVGDRSIYLLNECPACGAKNKAWISGGGRLKCWRTSCKASSLEGGLAPSRWIEDFETSADDSNVIPEISNSSQSSLPLCEARQKLRRAFEGSDDILINATPGLGKTHATLDHLARYCRDGHRAVYAAPTHALAREVLEKALALGIDTAHVRGMSEEICGQDQWREVQEFISRGFSPTVMYCRLRCTRRERCEYLQQRFDASLIVTSHAALQKHDWKGVGLFVVDESAATSLLESQVLPWAAMETIAARLPTDTANVIRAMQDCCREALATLEQANKLHAHSRLYASGPPEGIEQACSLWDVLCVPEAALDELQRDLGAFGQRQDETWLRWQWRLFEEGINLNALRWLEATLEARTKTAAPGTLYFRIARHNLQPFSIVRVMNHASALARDAQLILLDGTGDHAEVEGLWQRHIRLERVDAELPRLKSVWLQRGMGKGKVTRLTGKQLEKCLADCIRHLPDEASKVLLLTHMAREEEALETGRRIAPDRQWSGLHHFGPRGINAWQEFPAIIVMGTPTASPTGSLDAACAIFGKKADRLDWIRRQGLKDLSQGVHRIRPIKGDKTVIVMGSHWPDCFPPPGLVLDGRRKADATMEALRRLRIWVELFGVLTPEMAALAGIGCGKAGQELLDQAKRLVAHLNRSENGSIRKPGDLSSNPIYFLPTQIKYYIRVRNNSGSLDDTSLSIPPAPPQAILLSGNDSWMNLLAALQQDTGLPDLTVNMPSRGRPWKCIGFVEAAEDFYRSIGAPWHGEWWQGQHRAPLD